jgi:membrane protease YdiL (CAAX protease family)
LPSITSVLPEVVPFSINQEINRIINYNIPSLLLIWYLLSIRGRGRSRHLRPQFYDIVSLLLGLPGLLAIGFGLSQISSAFAGIPALPPPVVEAPRNLLQWIIMPISCLSTGYLEESYFRYYLLIRFWGTDNSTDKTALFGIILSVILFSLSHLYEGFWGVLNALFAGILLALIFRRYRSIHGIAWAHGLYNAFVYAMGVR